MPNVLDNIIVGAVADAQTYMIVVTWANGSQTVNTFRHLIGKGVMSALADPALFAKVRIGEHGRSLEWPGEIDFCADALWFEAHPEDAPKQTAEHPTG
jgi:hypothetical protein